MTNRFALSKSEVQQLHEIMDGREFLCISMGHGGKVFVNKTMDVPAMIHVMEKAIRFLEAGNSPGGDNTPEDDDLHRMKELL